MEGIYMKNTPIIIGIVAIVFAAGGFIGGMKYQQQQVKTMARGQFQGTNVGQLNRNRTGGNANNGGMIIGTIASMDTTTATVKLPDGSSKIILLAGSTVFERTIEGTKTDFTIGDRIGAFGTTNADGSVTAQRIQINPGQSRGVGIPNETITPKQ